MKKKRASDKVSVREAVALNLRALSLWWKRYPAMFVATAAYAVVNALVPYAGLYLSARIVDELSGVRSPEALLTLVLIMLFVTAGLSLLKAALWRWRNCERKAPFDRSAKLYADKLYGMDFCAVDDSRTHDLLSQMRQNAMWGGFGIEMPIWQFESVVKALFQIFGSVALTVSLFTLRLPESAGALTVLNSPLFAVLSAAVLLGVTLLVPALNNLAGSYFMKLGDELEEGNRVFGFYGFLYREKKRALDMRAYRQDILCRKNLAQGNRFWSQSHAVKASRGPMGLMTAAAAAMSYLFTGLVYVFVCLKAWGGAFGIGAVTQYIGAITLLSEGITALLSQLGEMRNNTPFLRKAFQFLDIPNAMYQGSLTVEKRADRAYEIEFRDVSFKYPGAEAWTLRHVSMKFNVGERLAVVGRNGSGKTTFIKLLCRLYDPAEGAILLNGIDIRKYDYLEYLSIFSVIFQDFKLLALPLAQNVAASINPDRARVEACLNKAGFSQRLGELGLDAYLYKGFDTEGVEISGGEAQKIAIARALYKDAPFIVMDEPTAALDPVAEYEVYTKFNEIIGDKTAIFISHRLSSCRFCDEIAVFDSGVVVQKGSHDALLKEENGLYGKLWRAQAQYYTEREASAQ
ncbi:MAG: ABC transporter ATP-binding protein [Clostridiaceae bacterium]|nr:ABC transporter ATP-binding protein/permease [Eubacteriales bacterium]